MIQSPLFCAVVVMFSLVVGCGTKTSQPAGPVDPSLTLEVVNQDIAKYNGKRVRWFGQAAKVETANAPNANGGKVSAVFIDTSTDFTKVMRGFAVEFETDKNLLSIMMDLQSKPCWVIGTIDGTRNEKATVKGVGEKELEMPFLTDVQIEQCQEPKK